MSFLPHLPADSPQKFICVLVSGRVLSSPEAAGLTTPGAAECAIKGAAFDLIVSMDEGVSFDLGRFIATTVRDNMEALVSMVLQK